MSIRLGFVALCLWCVLTATSTAVGQASDPSARFPVYVNAMYGYINQQGQLIIKPRFALVTNFSEGLAAVYENGYWNYIDTSGKVEIATMQRGNARPFSEGLAAVLFGNRYGYIDKKGEVVIEPQFEKAFDFSEGLARVKLNGQWAFIDKRGQTAFTAPFYYADDFRNGHAVVAKIFDDHPQRALAAGDIKVSYIGKTGTLAPIGWCNSASRFSEALAAISTDNNVITSFSREGHIIMESLSMSESEPGYKPATYSFINAEGKTVFKGTYEQIEPFVDRRAAVRINKKWGYINELGEMIIPAQFDWAASFSDGLAFVKFELQGEGYFIDTNGRVVFRTDASVRRPFRNGLVQLMSCITKPCQSMYVDKQGRTVWRGPAE